jgi:dTDP-4-amino-4,6-dideoxygalactose transaminase
MAPQVDIPFQHYAGKTAAHLMPILLPKEKQREEFMASMKEQGIQTSIHYPPIHTFTAYRNGKSLVLPLTDEVASREVTLPLYSTMTDEQVLAVAHAIHQALN